MHQYCFRSFALRTLSATSETAKPPGCDSQWLCRRPPFVPHENTARLGCRPIPPRTDKAFCQALMALSGRVFSGVRLINPAKLGATLETKPAIFKFQRRSSNCSMSLSFEYELSDNRHIIVLLTTPP